MNNVDLSHINKQIQKNETEIEAKRRQADSFRQVSDQKHGDGDNGGGDYYEREADNLEEQAAELEKEIEQLKLDKERKEKRIAILEEQKASIGQESTERLARIEKELSTLRGSDFML